MIIKNNDYMTGRDEGEYKGFSFKLNGYMGFKIKGVESFQPYAGNKLMDYDCKTIRLKLLAMIRYRINKHIEENKNGAVEE